MGIQGWCVAVALAVQTGLRVSEITGLRVADVHLGAGPYVRFTGKGRKDRATPLTRQTTAIMRGWLAERGGAGADPVFPGPDGKPLGTNAVRRLTQRHATTAAARCPSLSNKKVSPPTLRHTSAMRMLESGIDLATISLWLGYFSGVPDLSGSARRNRPAGPRQKPFCLPCTTGKL